MRTNCPWWSRWLHRRLREIDLTILLPAIQLRSEMKAQSRRFSDEWMIEVGLYVDSIWELHKSMPGQEHWHCPCSKV